MTILLSFAVFFVLTLGAFFRGWRWHALWVPGVGFGGCFILGFITGAFRLAWDLTAITTGIGFLMLICLVIMCVWVSPKIQARNEAIEAAKKG